MPKETTMVVISNGQKYLRQDIDPDGVYDDQHYWVSLLPDATKFKTADEARKAAVNSGVGEYLLLPGGQIEY